MRVLFGPQHDHLHVDPHTPGGYEWWYFDAISDDGKYALVVIFFLGTPMSPYYKAVVDAQKTGRTPPLPMDWCGVFISLHEFTTPSVIFTTSPSPAARKLQGSQWEEIAYAYNIYRAGDFSKRQAMAAIGASWFRWEENGHWRISLRESGLWIGQVRGDLTFTPTVEGLDIEPTGNEDGHTWVCIAPHCRVSGTITPASGKTISFSGDGYHDHNFGKLPWAGVEGWYWGRAHWHCDDGLTRTLLFYALKQGQNREQIQWLIQGKEILTIPDGGMEISTSRLMYSDSYGMTYGESFDFSADRPPEGKLFARASLERTLTNGPFYRRMTMLAWGGVDCGTNPEQTTSGGGWHGRGTGIAEIFQPSRLCDPLWSRLMWTRIRRRPLPTTLSPRGRGGELR